MCVCVCVVCSGEVNGAYDECREDRRVDNRGESNRMG